MPRDFFKVALKKPDGRNLQLYARKPIASDIVATNPRHDPITNQPHLRYHPLRGEWVAYASHRQNRTFLPPKEFSPLAVTTSAEFPTELPAGEYDIAVFENLFASLIPNADDVPPSIVPVMPGLGACEVVVFTQDPNTSLAKLPVDHVRLLLEVWSERTGEIGARKEIQFVMPFEDRGVEVGVTLHHPHGQIYAYPFLPPVVSRMVETQKDYLQKHGQGLLVELMFNERRTGERIVIEDEHTLAFVPACARYPYEVWIAPKRQVESLSQLRSEELESLARVLKTMLLKYDQLWNRPFPYLMTLYQAPTDGEPHPEFHFHIAFSPPFRAPDRLKFLAGTELGAGMFVNDSLPEEKAQELRAVEVSFE